MLEYIKTDKNGIKRLHANAVRFRNGTGRINCNIFGADGYYQAQNSFDKILPWDVIESVFDKVKNN
jgi:hypothetical protein